MGMSMNAVYMAHTVSAVIFAATNMKAIMVMVGTALAGMATEGIGVVNGKGVAQGTGIAKRQGKASGTGVVICRDAKGQVRTGAVQGHKGRAWGKGGARWPFVGMSHSLQEGAPVPRGSSVLKRGVESD